MRAPRIAAALATIAAAALAAAPATAQRATTAERAWAGRWALETRLASRTRIPLLPDAASVAVSLSLVDLTPGADGTWTQQSRVCDLDVEGGSLARITFPAAFRRALPDRRATVRLVPTDRGVEYRADTGVEEIGYDAARAGGQLPTVADHPAVRDPDGDGAPGVTVEIRMPRGRRGRIWMVQRSRLLLRGRSRGADRIEGTLQIPLLEQRVLGAEPRWLGRNPDPRADPGRSRFTLVRLPASADCGAARRAISSPNPPARD